MRKCLSIKPVWFVAFLMGLISPVFSSPEIQPHRAFYTVTLASSRYASSHISDVRGTMMIEIDKVCGGWTVQQRSETLLFSHDGSTEHVKWGYVTWESDDGKLMQFNTFRKTNGELVEDIRGTAKVKGAYVEVRYQRPEKKILNLPSETLFPIQHLKSLIKTAELGTKVFSHIVFDGSSTDGASEIDIFIGAKKEPKDINQKQLLVQQPFWTIRFAVYGLSKGDYEPEFLTTQELLPTGIIKEYTIDYDGIQIKGRLDRIELLQAKGC